MVSSKGCFKTLKRNSLQDIKHRERSHLSRSLPCSSRAQGTGAGVAEGHLKEKAPASKLTDPVRGEVNAS